MRADENLRRRRLSLVLGCLFLLLAETDALPLEVKQGDIVTLDGVLILSQGEDARQRQVIYPAIQLRRPLVVNDAGGHNPETRVVKLRLNRQQETSFRRLKGKQVRVSGKIHFYWFGPNKLPNPAHLEVFSISAR